MYCYIIFLAYRYNIGCLGLLLLCLSATQAAPEATNKMEIETADQETIEDDASRETDQSLGVLNNYMAKLMYKNQWDGPLSQQCPKGQGFYRVRSKHDNGREDRLWEFYCRNVIESGTPMCTTTSYINNFRQHISFMCGPNKYMAGVKSYHDNSKEDRRWQFTCCSAPKYITSKCRMTDYVNKLDQPMDFSASAGEVFTGVVSYYSAGTR